MVGEAENSGKNGKHASGLLEFIAFRAGCVYMSDLHKPQYLPAIRHTVRRVAPELYSLWEWNDTVQYITGMSGHFQDQEQAALFLQTYEKG